ncbi:MAG: hypothetical protein IJP17_07310 [Clostridia bacterium]|nr:hypothetical protein [Clostridia bacterium]
MRWKSADKRKPHTPSVDGESIPQSLRASFVSGEACRVWCENRMMARNLSLPLEGKGDHAVVDEVGRCERSSGVMLLTQ